MPEASDAVPTQIRHPFFLTANCSSRPVVTLPEPDGDTNAVPQPELPSPASTNVFNPALETTVEAVMRISATGPVPVESDVDIVGLVRGIGSQRRLNPNEVPMSAPLPPRDIQHRRGCIVPRT